MPHILLIDDNHAFRQSLRTVLMGSFPEMRVTEAKDGEEALVIIGRDPPALIFMDIRLPGESGLSLTKRIKADYPHIKIVIMTSYDYPEYRRAAEDCKADHFFSKGNASSSEIVEFVSKLFEKAQTS